MSLLVEILGAAFATTLSASTTIGLQKMLDEQGKEYYEKRVRESYPVLNGFLRELAEKSKTKVDDKGIDAICEAIKDHAALNGIDLE